MVDVFISYKRSDRIKVEKISSALEAHGLSVWFDHDLKVGNAIGFNSEIEQAIDGATVVLACWSKAAVESFFVKAESLRGLELEKLCPVFLEETNLPIPFNGMHTEDLSNWNGEVADPRWKNVLAIVKNKVAAGKAAGISATPYLEAMDKLTKLISESEIRKEGAAEVLKVFHESRWEITRLLYAVDALIPRMPEESIPYWRGVFNSGHFVPDEVIGRHAVQSLEEIIKLTDSIKATAEESLSVFRKASE